MRKKSKTFVMVKVRWLEMVLLMMRLQQNSIITTIIKSEEEQRQETCVCVDNISVSGKVKCQAGQR